MLWVIQKPNKLRRHWRLKPAPDAVRRGFWRGGNPLQLAGGGKLGLEISENLARMNARMRLSIRSAVIRRWPTANERESGGCAQPGPGSPNTEPCIRKDWTR